MRDLAPLFILGALAWWLIKRSEPIEVKTIRHKKMANQAAKEAGIDLPYPDIEYQRMANWEAIEAGYPGPYPEVGT